MLIGTYTTSVTSGRRIAIPKNFRSKLGERVIIAKWYEGCLVMISESNWSALLNRLTGEKKIFTAPVRDTDRFIMGSAYELVSDSQGRVMIPDQLAKFARISESVSFIGLGERIEIWDTKEWEKKESEIAAVASDLVEKLNAE